MYTLEFYDRVRDIERQYHFSHPVSPQQALDIFNKLGFDIYHKGLVDNPLDEFNDKDVPMERFDFKLSSYTYIYFDKIENHDYLLRDL